nr:MAG TPA: hypothetical protein [Caudoviricetes sp.]
MPFTQAAADKKLLSDRTLAKFNLQRLWSGRLKIRTAPGRSCDTAPTKKEKQGYEVS